MAILTIWHERREENENVILLPDQFSTPDFIGDEKNLRGSWMLLPGFTEQLVFDLRSEPTRALRQQFKSQKTFKGELDIWADDAKVIASLDVKPQHSVQTILHYIAEMHQFVYVVSSNRMVKLMFFKEPFAAHF